MRSWVAQRPVKCLLDCFDDDDYPVLPDSTHDLIALAAAELQAAGGVGGCWDLRGSREMSSLCIAFWNSTPGPGQLEVVYWTTIRPMVDREQQGK